MGWRLGRQDSQKKMISGGCWTWRQETREGSPIKEEKKHAAQLPLNTPLQKSTAVMAANPVARSAAPNRAAPGCLTRARAGGAPVHLRVNIIQLRP